MNFGPHKFGIVFVCAFLCSWTLGTASPSGSSVAKSGHPISSPSKPNSSSATNASGPNLLNNVFSQEFAARISGEFGPEAIERIVVTGRGNPLGDMLKEMIDFEDCISRGGGSVSGNIDRFIKIRDFAEHCDQEFIVDYFHLIEVKFFRYILIRRQRYPDKFEGEWALDLEQVSHKLYEAMIAVATNGNNPVYSEQANEGAMLAAKNHDYGSALIFMDTAIRNAKNDFNKARFLMRVFQYHLNQLEFEAAANLFDDSEEMAELLEVDWFPGFHTCANVELAYLNGDLDEAMEKISPLFEIEKYDSLTPEFKTYACSLLVRILCKKKEFFRVAEFERRVNGNLRFSMPVRYYLAVHLDLEALGDAKKFDDKTGREQLNKINRIQKVANKRDVPFHKDIMDLRMQVTTRLTDPDLIREQLDKKRDFESSMQSKREEFDSVLSNVGMKTLSNRPDGLVDANRTLAELNNKVNLIILGGIVAAALMAIAVLVRVKWSARKTQNALLHEMNRREQDFEAKIERQIEAHSKVMMSQVEFNQKIELELERKRRTDVLGILTGGVAHDFNNLLFVIQQSTENIRSHYAAKMDEEGVGLLDEADKAISIGKDIVNCLLSYAREQKLAESVVKIKTFLDEILPLLKSICGSDVELVIECENDQLEIFIDKGLLTTSIINLCVNSRDAMDGSGTIVIHCAKSKRQSELEIRVTDTGCGIEESKLESIFDPFYSSKETTTFSGNGIGLSMVQGFVTQSDGQIEIESIVGKGTTVILTFPFNRTPRVMKTAFQSADFDGRSVLLVDDNPMVRKTMYKTLDQLGFEVFTADGFKESVNCLESGRPVDLVITDIQLSGSKSGIELAKWIKFNHIETGVILISGGILQEIPFGCQFLAKPFSTAQLVEKMGDALNLKKSAE